MTVRSTASAAQRLLDALPQIFRIRDREQAERIAAAQGFTPEDELKDIAEGPLFTLLTALGQQLELLEAEVDWLYEDQFIETCGDWAVPYIGALVGARIIDTGDSESARLQVANTISNRRGKGTARSLADRVSNVMSGVPAEALEYARYVVQTYNPNFPGDGANMTIAVNGVDGRKLGLPLTIGQHVVELRDIREGGRFAPANVGARVWTTQAFEHRQVVPSVVTGGSSGRYRFDPLGRDIVLWSRGANRNLDFARLEPEEIPGPIALAQAVDEPRMFYGSEPEKSIFIRIDGNDQGITKVCFCDLSDDPATGGWNERGSPDEQSRIRIDPKLGRFVLPAAGAGVDPTTVRVRYHLGSAFRIGANFPTAETGKDEADVGQFPDKRDLRNAAVDFEKPAIRRVIALGTDPANAATVFKDALDALEAKPGVRIDFGGTLPTPSTTALPAGGNFEIRSEEVWPTIMLASPWALSGGAESILTLRGLRFAGGDLVIKSGGLRQLMLIDCTFVPGSAKIIIEDPECKLIAVRSILGQIRTTPSVEFDFLDCLIDSGDPDIPAIAALDGAGGSILWGERSTILGDVRALAFDEVSSCLFAERIGRSVTGPPVSAERLQNGCVRYSALPRGSIAPRRYRCFPAEDDLTSPAPVFASFDYGEAVYGSLVSANSDALLLGAENHGEMGVGNRTSFHRRKRLLDADLYDWVPFGMAAVIELAG